MGRDFPSNPEKRSSLLTAYLTLVRVPNSVMVGLAVVVGEAMALNGPPDLGTAVLGFLTASLMMAGTMVMNDVYDVESDRLNNPRRPIPSGRVGGRQAMALAAVLSSLAIVSSFILGPQAGLTAIVALVLMVYYNTRGKRTGLLGNGVVSFNVALPFFFGGVAVGVLRPLLFIFSVMAFLANLGREVAKGIPDVQGDQAHGVRTLAVSSGSKAAATVAAVLFLAAVVLSILPAFLNMVSVLYFPSVAVADVGFAYSSYKLITNPTPEEARRVKNQVLVWMLLGLVGFLLSSVTVG